MLAQAVVRIATLTRPKPLFSSFICCHSVGPRRTPHPWPQQIKATIGVTTNPKVVSKSPNVALFQSWIIWRQGGMSVFFSHSRMKTVCSAILLPHDSCDNMEGAFGRCFYLIYSAIKESYLLYGFFENQTHDLGIAGSS